MFRALLLSAALCCLADATKKVLVLHGGGDSANGMQSLTKDLLAALGNNYEFVYGHIGAASTGEAWWNDPVSKGQPTTDRDQAKRMVNTLNAIVDSDGPFEGIMGYSQGAAAIPVYLSQVKTGTFKFAVMFCGYIPTTHSGLVARISETSPFGNIRALIWMSHEDPIISNPMSVALSKKFTHPSVVVDDHGGPHLPPTHSKATFNTVVTWIKDPSKTVISGTPLTSRISFWGTGGKGGKGGKGGGKGGKGGGKGGKGGKGKGGQCGSDLSQADCTAQGCTYYEGKGCYGGFSKNTGGNGKGDKGDNGKGKGNKGDKGDNGKGKGNKGEKGDGKAKGGRCALSLSSTECSASGCTYYEGYGCYGRKAGGDGKGKGDKGEGKGNKGDKGDGKAKGGNCALSLSSTECSASGCTYYEGYGCYGRKAGGDGKGKGDNGEGKGNKGDGKAKGGRCARDLSQADCTGGCTYYEGYGCYRNKGGQGGKGEKGQGGKGEKGQGGKGEKGGNGKGGQGKGCDFQWSERRCNNNDGCTYYDGFGCFADKSGNNGKVVVVKGRYLRR